MNQDVNHSHHHQQQKQQQFNVTLRAKANNKSSSHLPHDQLSTVAATTTTTTTTTNNNGGSLSDTSDSKQTTTKSVISVGANNNTANNTQNNMSIITSVERPSSQLITTTNQSNEKTSIPVKQTSNSSPTNSTTSINDNQASASKSTVIISQLQHLQSPPPQQTEARDSPIAQVTKTRHRGFLSQLLCCFRPSSSNIYQDSAISIYSNVENGTQNHNSINQKYSGKPLLPPRKPSDNRICLIIDLDETLVHSSFKPIENADFIVPVEIDGTLHKVYVLKRPYVDEFLKRVGQIYECVLFTASLAKYADPVADLLDKDNIFKARLFRESCAFYRGNYVKDLGRLGRDLNRVIIVDNSPASYIFHPDNALPVSSYFDDKSDSELLNLIPLLERVAKNNGTVVPIN